MRIRGFAIAYDFEVEVEGVRERVRPWAFRPMLRRGCDVKLQGHSHDAAQPSLASIRDGTLTLFESPQALCFEVSLPDQRSETWQLAQSVISTHDCSVNFDWRRTRTDETTEDGVTYRSIRVAFIDHICVGIGGGAYAGEWCCCWPVIDSLNQASRKIQDAAREWDSAYSRYGKSAIPQSRTDKAPVMALSNGDHSVLIDKLRREYPSAPPQALGVLVGNALFGHDISRWPRK